MSRFKPAGQSTETPSPQPAHTVTQAARRAAAPRQPAATLRPPGFEPPARSAAYRPAPSVNSSAAPLPADEPLSTQESLAITFTLAYFFLRVSFLHNLLAAKLHADVYLVVIVGALAYLGLLRSATWQPCFKSKIFWCWALFSALLAIGIPFSFWPGGSKDVVLPFIKNDFICIPFIAGLFTTERLLRRFLRVLSWAGILFILVAAAWHSDLGGRMILEWSGSADNSNDLAAHLIFVLPFVIFPVLARDTKHILRPLFFSGLPLALYLILGTGSRGAFIGLAAGVLYTLIAGSMKVRVGFVVALLVMGAALVTFVPQSALSRLTTYDNPAQDDEAVASYEARQQLLIKSWNITLQHPFLGAGPGQFGSFEGSTAAKEGHSHNNWQETHNSYTEVSSEDGIPALLCFLGGLLGTFVLLSKTVRAAKNNPEMQDFRLVCQFLLTGLAAFSVCIFFLSLAYRYYLPLMGGLAIALHNIVMKSNAALLAANQRAADAPPQAVLS